MLCLLLTATTVFSYLRGRNDVWISEFKIYDANLILVQHFETNLAPEIKEFMKGRYYYLANKIPINWLGSPYDYGQVSNSVSHLNIGKGDTGAQYEYGLFKKNSVSFRDLETGKLK